MITRTDIAEIWEALGKHQQAATYRLLAGEEWAGERVAAANLRNGVDGVERLLAKTVEQDRAKHDENCWTKHSCCLADKIRELLPS